jgi:membrane-associated protein
MGFNLQDALIAAGPFAMIVIFAIVFAENGLFLGFFLPGDSLLFTAGFLASPAASSFLPLPVLLIGLLVCAIAGEAVGYWFGQRVGRRFFQREDSLLFHRKHLETAHEFYEKHGARAIILARFLPIVRTFVPIVAGIALMSYSRFMLYNVIGGVAWVCALTLFGYFVGGLIPGVDKYLELIVAAIILLSIAPTALHVYKENRTAINGWVASRLSRGRGPEPASSAD